MTYVVKKTMLTFCHFIIDILKQTSQLDLFIFLFFLTAVLIYVILFSRELKQLRIVYKYSETWELFVTLDTQNTYRKSSIRLRKILNMFLCRF